MTAELHCYMDRYIDRGKICGREDDKTIQQDVETDHAVLQQNAPAVLRVWVSAKLNILVPSRTHSQALFSSSFI